MRMRVFQCAVVALAVGMVVLVPTTVSFAALPAWDSYQPAVWSDILLEVDGFKYTLTLGLSPTLTLNGTTYPVNWLQSFCLVSQAKSDYFVASGGPAGSWGFDTWLNDPGKIAVAGWAGPPSSDRLYPGQSKEFVFGSLDTTGNMVVTGLHIGYGTALTSHFKESSAPPIPEWGSLALAALALPPVAFFRRRLHG